MRSTLIAAVVTASSLLVGCPNPPECAEEAACPDGLTSDGGNGGDGGICRETSHPSAPNVLDNPSFECGTDGWAVLLSSEGVLSAETGVTRSGKGAARLTASGTGRTRFAHLAVIKNPKPGSVWCAQAWMRGTASDGKITVLRVGSDVAQDAFTPVTNTEWSRTSSPFRITIDSADKELDLLVAIPYPKAGDYLLVDDVALWQSEDGSCTER